MTIIFPGWSRHDRSVDSTKTEHLFWLADRIGEGERQLTSDERKAIDRLLRTDGREPGPIERRLSVESALGGTEAMSSLQDVLHVLERWTEIGVEHGTVDRLQAAATRLDAALEDVPTGARARLRWLLTEMHERVHEEPSDLRLGDINAFTDEAAYLAVMLGGESAPVQRTRYDRDGESSVTPLVGTVYPDPPYWLVLRHRHTKFIYVSGHRLHDPIGGFPNDITAAALIEGDDPTKPKLYDPWAQQPKTEQRGRVLLILGRWVRWLDSRPDASDGQRPDSSQAGHDGDDPDARLSAREIAERFGVNAEALRKRLDRFRKSNHTGWDEVTDQTVRGPTYLYRLSAVQSIVDSMLASADASAKRPSTK